jgi:2-keto-3-deoxy-6-phosphogluconate aldolase
MSEFIFMLTHGDVTVPDALELCRGLDDERLRYVGFKDVGLPFAELRELVEVLHDQGRTVMLEVVSERRDDELRSVEAAIDLGVDYLLGGVHVSEALALLDAGDGDIRYFPFAGEVYDHPSVLLGTVASVVASTRRVCARDGVDGVDLLAYRFEGDGDALLAEAVQAVDKPIIAAGSVDNVKRVRAVARAGAWGFTVGTAAFQQRFAPGERLPVQLRTILEAAEAARA